MCTCVILYYNQYVTLNLLFYFGIPIFHKVTETIIDFILDVVDNSKNFYHLI